MRKGVRGRHLNPGLMTPRSMDSECRAGQPSARDGVTLRGRADAMC
jgi:hypothetical protein